MCATAPGILEHPHPRVVHYTLVALTPLSGWGDNALGPGLSSPVKKPPSCSLASCPLGLAVAVCETGLAVQAPRLAHTFLVFWLLAELLLLLHPACSVLQHILVALRRALCSLSREICSLFSLEVASYHTLAKPYPEKD